MTTNRRIVLAAVLCVSSVLLAVPAGATLNIFICHDHPDGVRVPPTYGLRIDDLVGSGAFTFSFDYFDGTGAAGVTLTWDDVTGQIHIFGRAYGGLDTGSAWADTLKGWIDIDFYYRDFVSTQDDCSGAPGDDAYVTGESANNSGTIALDGWGGNQVFTFEGKSNTTGCAFILDNDTDSKGNPAIAGDLALYSASGWLKPPTNGARDWLFVAEAPTVPVKETSWGAIKSLYR